MAVVDISNANTDEVSDGSPGSWIAENQKLLFTWLVSICTMLACCIFFSDKIIMFSVAFACLSFCFFVISGLQ